MSSPAEPSTLARLCLASGPSTLWGLQILGTCNGTYRKGLPQRIEGRGFTLRGLLSSKVTGEPGWGGGGGVAVGGEGAASGQEEVGSSPEQPLPCGV